MLQYVKKLNHQKPSPYWFDVKSTRTFPLGLSQCSKLQLSPATKLKGQHRWLSRFSRLGITENTNESYFKDPPDKFGGCEENG